MITDKKRNILPEPFSSAIIQLEVSIKQEMTCRIRVKKNEERYPAIKETLNSRGMVTIPYVKQLSKAFTGILTYFSESKQHITALRLEQYSMEEMVPLEFVTDQSFLQVAEPTVLHLTTA